MVEVFAWQIPKHPPAKCFSLKGHGLEGRQYFNMKLGGFAHTDVHYVELFGRESLACMYIIFRVFLWIMT